MALQKAIDLNNGVKTEAAYIEVSNLTLDYENMSGNFMVKTYLDKATKEAGLGTLVPAARVFITNSASTSMPPMTKPTDADVKLFTSNFLTGEARSNAYKYLKTLPDYSDCVDVQ